MNLETLAALVAVLAALWALYERYLRSRAIPKEARKMDADFAESFAMAAQSLVTSYDKLAVDLGDKIDRLSAKVEKLETMLLDIQDVVSGLFSDAEKLEEIGNIIRRWRKSA